MKTLCLPCLLLMLCCSGQQVPDTFHGVLDSELIPTPLPRFYARLEPLPPSEAAQLGLPLGDSPVLQASWPIDKDDSLRVLLVEPPGGQPLIYADENMDGTLDPQERFAFEPLADDPRIEGKAVLELPSKNDLYRSYPVAVFLPRENAAGEESGMQRHLLRSGRVSVAGKVDIAGRDVAIRFDNVDRRTGLIDFRNGGLGIDADGDGEIRYGVYSPEHDFAYEEDVVFKVGDYFVSTQAADTTTRRITLRSYSASDYERIVPEAGVQMPDFAFVDFGGQQRRLSDFRGKHVLLDFWGTWCSPCIQGFPKLKAAYKDYRHRGFEILGMNYDPHERALPDAQALQEAVDKAQAVLDEHGVTWPQARLESIHYLMTKRLRISVFPTLILLDPQGVIVSVSPGSDQLSLASADLLATLEKVLPPA